MSPLDALEGRITAVLLTPYPPGIPLLVPGERINASIMKYLKFEEQFNASFPRFETLTHGMTEADGDAPRSVICARE
jgi:arginine decarboxylase